MKTTLTRADHELLLFLIRGCTVAEIASMMKITSECASTRIARIRHLVGARTNYELIALEVINLMEADEAAVASLLAPRAEAAAV